MHKNICQEYGEIYKRILEIQNAYHQEIEKHKSDSTLLKKYKFEWEKYYESPDDYWYRKIKEKLGENFMTPSELEQANGFSYTKLNRAHLMRSTPNKKLLDWCEAKGFILFPGPPDTTNLEKLLSQYPELFKKNNREAILHDDDDFIHDQNVHCQWYMIRKGPLGRSLGETWEEQIENAPVKFVEMIPTAVEVVYMAISYKLLYNQDIFKDEGVRTYSNSGLIFGLDVTIEDSVGIVIGTHMSFVRYDHIGVATRRVL